MIYLVFSFLELITNVFLIPLWISLHTVGLLSLLVHVCVITIFSWQVILEGQQHWHTNFYFIFFFSSSNLLISQVILTELYSTGFQRSFADDDDLTSISDSDVVYAFQAPPLHGRGGSAQHSGNHGNKASPKNTAVTDFPLWFDSFAHSPFPIFSLSLSLCPPDAFSPFTLTPSTVSSFFCWGSSYVSLSRVFLTGRHFSLEERRAVSTACFVFLLSVCFFMHDRTQTNEIKCHVWISAQRIPSPIIKSFLE